MKHGVGAAPCVPIADRRSAIDEAIRLAQPGDTVIVAGKGHERYQVIGTRHIPFDDVEVVRSALVRRRGPGGNGHVVAKKAS